MTVFQTGKIVVRIDGEAFLVKSIRKLPKLIYKGCWIDIQSVLNTYTKKNKKRTVKFYEGFSYSIYELNGKRSNHLKSKYNRGYGKPFNLREDAIKQAKQWIDENFQEPIIQSNEMRFI